MVPKPIFPAENADAISPIDVQFIWSTGITPGSIENELSSYCLILKKADELEVVYDGHTYSGSTSAQSFIVSMLTKIEGEAPSATRNIYAIDGRTREQMTKTELNDLISLIDIAQELITGA